MPDAVQPGEKVFDRGEAQAALSELSSRNHLGLKLGFCGHVFPEEKTLADIYLSAGADQAFPLIRVSAQLAGKKDLDASAEKVVRGRITLPERLRFEPAAAAIKARGKHPCVVEDEKIVRSKEIGKVSELPIFA